MASRKLLVFVSLALVAAGLADARMVRAASAADPWAVVLPPGVRSDGERLAPVGDGGPGTPPIGVPLVERVPWTGDGTEWLEVEYTVDPLLDERIRRILAASGIDLGLVVVLEPTTGAVLSYVATDPERFPATRTYPTASLMKVVTASAVLRYAPAAVDRPCRYLGSPYELRASQLEPPSVGGRFVPFWRAMATSNNQCFARLAVDDVGREGLLGAIREIGLLEPPGALHPAGRVDAVEGALDLGRLGSGLAGSFVSPLSAARLAAALAHGRLVEPYWIAALHDAEGRPRPLPARGAPREVWAPDVADALRELMVGVTERGTARSAFRNERGEPLLGDVRVSGKTGTLSGRDPDGRYRWFIGVAPADAPRVAMATLVVDGSSSAAKVAAAILRDLFCGPGPCDGARLDALHARIEERARVFEGEVAAAAPARPSEPGGEAPAEVMRADWTELDELPRPIATSGFDLPRRLLRRPARGEVVLLIELSPDGEVVSAEVEASDLPEFDRFVIHTVERWRFTPPTRGGHRVATRARLPIPIRVN